MGLICFRCGDAATHGIRRHPLCKKCWNKTPIKVWPRTDFSRRLENFINSFRTFKKIEVEKFSDEWFNEEMKKVQPRGTICETHRLLYKAIMKFPDGRDRDASIAIFKRAFLLGHNIVVRLKEYSGDKHAKRKNSRLLLCPNCGYKCFSFEDRKCRYCGVKMKTEAK